MINCITSLVSKIISVLCEHTDMQCLLHSTYAGVTLSSTTAAIQKQPSDEGIQRVVEEITARDKTV